MSDFSNKSYGSDPMMLVFLTYSLSVNVPSLGTFMQYMPRPHYAGKKKKLKKSNNHRFVFEESLVKKSRDYHDVIAFRKLHF